MNVREQGDLYCLFWLAYEEHVAAGGIVPGSVLDAGVSGRHTDGLAWLGVARNSDFRSRPFRGL